MTYAMKGAVGVLAVLILGAFSLSALDRYLLGSSTLAAVVSAVLVDLTNNERSAEAVDGLTVSPALTAAAQAKANDMAEKGYFAHTSPEGLDSWYWFRQAGYSFLYAGENLAVDFSDSKAVEKAWMASPTHRANIVDGHFTQIGIATAHGTYEGHPTTFVVEMFGAPAKPRAVVVAKAPQAAAPALAQAQIQTETQTPAPAAPAEKAPPAVTQTAPVVLGTEADSIFPPPAHWWQQLLASPKSMLRYVYIALALLILGALVLVTRVEFKREHARHAVVAAVLFALMAGLFTLAQFALFAPPVIAASL